MQFNTNSKGYRYNAAGEVIDYRIVIINSIFVIIRAHELIYASHYCYHLSLGNLGRRISK